MTLILVDLNDFIKNRVTACDSFIHMLVLICVVLGALRSKSGYTDAARIVILLLIGDYAAAAACDHLRTTRLLPIVRPQVLLSRNYHVVPRCIT